MSGLQTDNLTVGYGSPLVKEISLCVRPGRVLTLIGPNGCGKSTILKSVTRQLKIMGGSIFLGGQAMETMKEAEMYFWDKHKTITSYYELLSGEVCGRYELTQMVMRS